MNVADRSEVVEAVQYAMGSYTIGHPLDFKARDQETVMFQARRTSLGGSVRLTVADPKSSRC